MGRDTTKKDNLDPVVKDGNHFMVGSLRYVDIFYAKIIDISIDAIFSRAQKMRYMGDIVLINEVLKISWVNDLRSINSHSEKFLFTTTRLFDAYNLKRRRDKKTSLNSLVTEKDTACTLDRDAVLLLKSG